MNKLLVFSIFLLFLALVAFGFNQFFLSPVGTSSQTQIFIVPEDTTGFGVVSSLKNQNLIKNEKAFRFTMNYLSFTPGISSGGFNLAQDMNAWQILKKISGKPDLLWITTSFCIRKEQVGEILQKNLDWNDTTLGVWNSLYKNPQTDYFEGVYYPDTYLIPADAAPAQIANRYINHFNEEIAPLNAEMSAKNIKWTTVLKIASLIARESGGPDDAKIISGIIWNRLDRNMPLQIDATMAYTLGKSNGSWWANIDVAQKQSDSPYNSYKYKGLPPTPICSPDINAIDAALNPAPTDCLFYLHDSNKQIHCAATYAEHLQNIQTYLR